MTDPEKLIEIRRLIDSLAPEFRPALAQELMKAPTAEEDPPEGELQMIVRSNEEGVRIDFQKKVAWIALPKPQAINFASLILEHCGAVVERVAVPPPAPPA